MTKVWNSERGARSPCHLSRPCLREGLACDVGVVGQLQQVAREAMLTGVQAALCLPGDVDPISSTGAPQNPQWWPHRMKSGMASLGVAVARWEATEALVPRWTRGRTEVAPLGHPWWAHTAPSGAGWEENVSLCLGGPVLGIAALAGRPVGEFGHSTAWGKVQFHTRVLISK